MTVGNPGCVRKAAPPTLYAPSPSPPLPSSPAVSCMLGGSRLSPSPRAVASEDGDAVSAFCRCGEKDNSHTPSAQCKEDRGLVVSNQSMCLYANEPGTFPAGTK